MSETMTKDLVMEKMRSRFGLSVREARDVVEFILEDIKSAMEQGEEVKISGFGKWTIRSKKSRPGRNPHTGERIEITPRRVVTFHPSDKLRDALNQGT
jgi:integration host factor subunit alpha